MHYTFYVNAICFMECYKLLSVYKSGARKSRWLQKSAYLRHVGYRIIVVSTAEKRIPPMYQNEEETNMSDDKYIARNSAQNYLNKTDGASFGSSCGAAAPEKEQPSACGAADPEPKREESSSCGASCGATDPEPNAK